MNRVRTLLDKLASLFLKIQGLPLYRAAARRLRPAVRICPAGPEEACRALDTCFGPGQGYHPRSEVTPFVAYVGGSPAGFVELVRNDPLARSVPGYWLFSLYVRNRYRGFGVGADLCRAVIAAARAEGANSVTLFVDAGNAPACALYRKLGFQTITDSQELKRLHPDEDPCPPAVMRIVLA